MARQKSLLGLDVLNKGVAMLDKGIPLTTVFQVLHLADKMSYGSARLAFKEDRANNHKVTRPEWLQPLPDIQLPPANYVFAGKYPTGLWVKVDA